LLTFSVCHVAVTAGGGQGGQGCMALDTRKKCLKGTDEEDCKW